MSLRPGTSRPAASNPLESLVRHKTTRRAFLTALAAGGSAAALAGCSTAGTSTDGSTGGDGDSSFSFFSWATQKEFQPMLDLWKKQNPNVSISFSNSPPVDQYISALQTRILSGTAADVFVIAAENKTNLINGKAVQDLTGKPYMQVIAPANAKTYSRDGADYGMSTSSWGAGIVYNKAALAKVGASAVPATWDEFLALCKELAASGITPYLEAVQGMPTTLAAILGAQNEAMGGTMDAKIFDGSSSFEATWVTPLTQWARLWTEKIVSTDAVGIKGDQVKDEFTNGRLAMFTTGPWDMKSIHAAAPDMDFSMAQVPGITGGKPFLAGAASPGYAINSKTKKGELAEKFLTMLASEEGIQTLQESDGSITTTSNYQPKVDPALTEVVPFIRDGQYYLPQIAWTRAEDKLNEAATAQLQLLVQGSATPQQVAAQLDQVLKNNS